MSDRVAVFRGGAIEQVASPEVLYEEPERAFVAHFIGENNRLNGVVRTVGDGVCEVEVGDALIKAVSLGQCPPGAAATVVVRPERVNISLGEGRHSYANELDAEIEDIAFLGDHIRLRLKLCEHSGFIVKIPNIVGHGGVLEGDRIRVGWTVLDCRALQPDAADDEEDPSASG